MERSDYLEFVQCCGFSVSGSGYVKHIKHAFGPIAEEEARSYEMAVSLAKLGPADVMIDGQHCNPQRSGKSAQQCTQSAMLHCPEGSVVLGQQHVTADTMKAEKIEPNKSKDVLSLRKSLEWCATSLPTLRAVIVDACSSAPKLFNEIIKPRFPSAFLAEDAWHHDKNLKADFTSRFDNARVRLDKSIGPRSIRKNSRSYATSSSMRRRSGIIGSSA